MTWSVLQATREHMTRPRMVVPRADSYWPSEASVVGKDGQPRGACLRASWYRLMAGELGLTRLPTKESTEWAGELGKAVEKLLVEKWKEMGIWVDNNTKFYIKDYNVSGEIDCIVRDPDGSLVIIENKTFWNYQAAKEIVGNKYQAGRPKEQHLLQTMMYLDVMKDTIKQARLTYEARDSSKKAEFLIRLHEKNGEHFALIKTIFPEEGTAVLNEDFSLEDIYRRYAELKTYHESKVPPPRDYQIEWTDEQIETKWAAKELAKTKYEAWQKKGVRPGDWNCAYCQWAHVCWNRTPTSDEEEAD